MITENEFLKIGFSVGFLTDPQEEGATKQFKLNDLIVIMPNENKNTFLFKNIKIRNNRHLKNIVKHAKKA